MFGHDFLFDRLAFSARKKSLELHYIDIAGEKYLMDVFSNTTVNLRKFKFKKFKVPFRQVQNKSKAIQIIQQIMDDGYFILNLDYLNNKLSTRLQNSFDLEEVRKRDRFELHLLTIGNKKYLVDLYSDNKINLKPYKFKKFPIQYLRIKDSKKALKKIEDILNEPIEITNLKDLKKKIGFLKLTSIEEIKNQLDKYSILAKNLDLKSKKLIQKVEKKISEKKQLIRTNPKNNLIRDHNKLVLLKNNFLAMLEELVEEISNAQERLNTNEYLGAQEEREKIIQFGKTFKLLKFAIIDLKEQLKET